MGEMAEIPREIGKPILIRNDKKVISSKKLSQQEQYNLLFSEVKGYPKVE